MKKRAQIIGIKKATLSKMAKTSPVKGRGGDFANQPANAPAAAQAGDDEVTYPEVLAELIASIFRLSEVMVIDPEGTKLSAIPNLTIEPSLRLSINRKWWPNGGGIPANTIVSSWMVAFLARMIFFRLTGR